MSINYSDQEYQALLRSIYLEYIIGVQKRNDELEKENKELRDCLNKLGGRCPCGEFVPNIADSLSYMSGKCVSCDVPFCGNMFGCKGNSRYDIEDNNPYYFCKKCAIGYLNEHREVYERHNVYKNIDDVIKHLDVCNSPATCTCGAHLRK